MENETRRRPALGVTFDSPSVAVGSVDVHAKVQQELDYVVVSGTDGVVQRCDALVVGSAGILHLKNHFLKTQWKDQ